MLSVIIKTLVLYTSTTLAVQNILAWGNNYDPTHVKVATTNPAGVNLGAVMMALCSANKDWYRTRNTNANPGAFVLVTNYSNRQETKNVTIDLGSLGNIYSSEAEYKWPDAYAAALTAASWPLNPDESLAAIGIPDAFQAITGYTSSNSINMASYTPGSSTWTESAYLGYTTSKWAMVYTTKKADTRFLKANYAYAWLGGNNETVWLGDPSIEGEDKLYYVKDIAADLDYSYSLLLP